MTVLERVGRLLDSWRVDWALIGASAMAAWGVSRSTLDVDILVTDASLLAVERWAGLRSEGCTVTVSRGDADDPLAGVVRLRATTERPLDVVVGRSAWQRALLRRCKRVSVAGVAIPIASPADLVLLKLYAGGAQDAWDVQQLLGASRDRAALVAEIEAALGDLPEESRALWLRLRAE